MKVFSFAVVTVACLAACASTPQQKQAQEKERRAVEVQDEVSVGREMGAKLYGRFGRWTTDKGLAEYISLVGKTLALRYGRPELSYRFGLLDTQEVNAFAAPGGYIFVTKGLLTQIANESELAAVLAHEITHINEKHMYLAIMPKHDVSAEESVARVLARGRSDLGKSLTLIADQGLKLLLEDGLGAGKEVEADEAALLFVATVGYNPHCFIEFLKRLEKNQERLKFGKVAQPLGTRIAGLSHFLEENGVPNKTVADKKVLDQRFQEAWRGLSTGHAESAQSVP